jgi:hypothetical protein
MKKIITTLAVSAMSVAAFAQGYINWTGASTSLYVQTNGTVYSSFEAPGSATLTGTAGVTTANSVAGNAALGYSGYYYELLTSSTAGSAPTTTAGLSAWSDTGLGATNSASANGKIVQVNGTALTQVNNWPVNATQAVIMVGWSANLGSSWSTVLGELQNWQTQGTAFVNNSANAAYFGVSSFGSGVAAVASSASANEVIQNNGGATIYNPSGSPMYLDELGVSVPEPATMALAALGGASLLLFRRRK